MHRLHIFHECHWNSLMGYFLCYNLGKETLVWIWVTPWKENEHSKKADRLKDSKFIWSPPPRQSTVTPPLSPSYTYPIPDSILRGQRHKNKNPTKARRFHFMFGTGLTCLRRRWNHSIVSDFHFGSPPSADLKSPVVKQRCVIHDITMLLARTEAFIFF